MHTNIYIYTIFYPRQIALDLSGRGEATLSDGLPHPPLRPFPINTEPVVVLLSVPLSDAPDMLSVGSRTHQKNGSTVMYRICSEKNHMDWVIVCKTHVCTLA